MSNILDEVLKIKPSNWEYDDYTNKIFSRRPVSSSSSEYADIEFAFIPHHRVRKIERVQNPFLYGKYIIRKEQLTNRGKDVREVRCYYGVDINDIDSALEYNCDPRFTSDRCTYLDRCNPVFFMDPSCITNDAIIVLSALLTTNESQFFKKCTDTEYYPQYIVFLL